jgi:putative DNA primase/helicase
MTGNISDIFGGPYVPPKIYDDPPELQIQDAMRGVGLDAPAKIIIDGQIHRFATKGKRDDSGWYIFFDGEPVAGCFGSWRDGIDVPFRSKMTREITPAEQMALTKRMAEAKAARDAERQRKASMAADTVSQIWESAGAASPDHPYLKRKGIQPHGVRITGDGRIMAPLHNNDGELVSLQYISEDGEKRYHPGAATKSAYWLIGDVQKTVFIAEGFATAATILEVTGQAVAIAYSAGNLPSVTGQVRERFGATQEIVIVADNDESDLGKKYADQAAAKYGARIVMPPIQGDANDYVQSGHDLNALLYPPVSEWLIQADEFSSQPSPIAWLVKHWLQDHALIMVHGMSGGGKTFVVLDMAMRIASTMNDWCGNKVHNGSVVYLAGEGHYGLRGRVAAWKQHNKIDKLNMYLSRAGCDLNTPDGYQLVLDNVRSLPEKPRIIIVDTLHRFLSGDENSAQDAKSMLDACSALMLEFGCSVLLVHHTGVSEEAQHRARGSSAWRGALDIEISVVPAKAPGLPLEIVQRKSKDAEIAEPIYGTLEQVEIEGWIDEDGEPVTSAVLTQSESPSNSGGESEIIQNKKRISRAWEKTGFDKDSHGRPYITAEGLERFLHQWDGKSKRQALNDMNSPVGLLQKMLNAEVLKPIDHGYYVADSALAASMMIMKNNGGYTI